MKIILASVIASFAAGTAFAGSLDYTPVETAPAQIAPQTFQDVSWTGGYAGLQLGSGDLDASFEGQSESVDVDAVGIHAGYLFDVGQFVVGGELSYDNVSLDDDNAELDGGDADLLRLRGRAGYDLGKFMPFVTLGASRLSGDGDSETGLTYGIGADYMISDRFVVGLEYSRSEFNDFADVDGADVDMDLIQIRGSYRF
jgi:opacity protein-like surface antigen